MKEYLFLLGLLLSTGSYLIAQEGEINVIKDPRVNALVAKQSAVTPPDVNPRIPGYRIQLFFDSERAAVNSARSQFLNEFSRIDTYVEYNSPYYYLKVGDFRTRLEAEKIKAAMEAQFPTSFIIEEDINLPRLQKEKVDK